ncbi:hypothetical protein OIU84_029602 [Salix udensis]|uniref:Leucine-rich repeat-containing N-terminal plant-type domain-containing protein n=1 Tax=Salix udensis TaxID=889485 RepID=A0AAD6P802_9ROSI|nr:hypothetical protein OIU84_029602 [Salix udensis]
MTLFTLFSTLSLLFLSTSGSDLRSLLEFKKGILSDPLDKILSKWDPSSIPDPNSCPSSWPGISCDPNSDSVIAITLDHLSLTGNLKFSTLLDLKSLQNISFSGNQFTGRIVPALGSMSSLQYLDLSDNNFSGPIPGRIAELWNLKYLNLSMNGFEGGFPVGSPVGFRNLQQLRVLDLRSNRFWGDIGGVLSELINLESVDLSDNEFFGGFSEISVENVSGLANTVHFVNLSKNKLNGGFFKADVIALFRNLEVLDLGDNEINGKMPSFGSLTNLKVLRLGNNQLFGGIPEELINGSIPLEELDLSGNGFTGSIHGTRSTTLNILNLSSNGLTGNRFSGPIPVQGNFANLRSLNLSSNELSGQLPIQLSKLTHLQYLDLSSNKFQGKITDKLPSSLIGLNMSNNNLSGNVPLNLRNKFDISSFRPGNPLLIIPNAGVGSSTNSVPDQISVHAFVVLAYQRAQRKEFHGKNDFSGQTTREDAKQGRSSQTSLFNFHSNAHRPQTSLSFSNDHLLTANSRSLSGQAEFETEIVEHDFPEGMAASSSSIPNLLDDHPTTSGKMSSPGSPLSSSPHFVEPTKLDVYSPDRLVGELSFLDSSLAFTAEELSRAPAEVLGRSSHGTLYKATLDSGHMLTVKWLRAGLVKHKKEFAKEVKKIGSLRHQNIVPLRAFYWGS